MKLNNPFKKALQHQQTQYGIWMSATSPYMAEITATANYDWCLIDGEHAPNTIENIHRQLQAIAPYAMHPVVRVAEGTTVNIKQVLDIGALSVLVPMVDTAEQARQIVQATQYAPKGNRGVGAVVARAARWGRVSDYMAQANEDICLLIQIESKTAVENIDEILAVEGIDGAFVGAADLSASLGYPDNPQHEEVQKTMKYCIDKIIASGKAAGFLAPDPTVAKKVIDWGVTFIAVGIDTMLFTQAIDDRLALFKHHAGLNTVTRSSY